MKFQGIFSFLQTRVYHIKFMEFFSLLQNRGLSYLIFQDFCSILQKLGLSYKFLKLLSPLQKHEQSFAISRISFSFSNNMDNRMQFLEFFTFSKNVDHDMQFIEFVSLSAKTRTIIWKF